MATILPVNDENLALAVRALRDGDCIGLPTETVYGLAADATNAAAVGKIFALKGRPSHHPLIVHLAHSSDARAWASEWSDAAQTLASAFWPGPMTLIVKRASHVLDAVTGGQDTVGLRVPSHPVAQRMLEKFGNGVAAPSANKFGHVSPTTARHVADEFASDDLLILDGGDCEVGVESTIIDVSGNIARVLRPGRVRAQEIERVIGRSLALPIDGNAKNVPRVSGSLDSHYAPRKKTVMLNGDALDIFLDASRDARKRVGLIFHSQRFANEKAHQSVCLDGSNAQCFEHEIYAKLRALDDSAIDLIAIETPPSSPDWDAVNDRLRRATFSKL
jgi:L-threonylcarbamoyladenylate synthase